MIYMDNAATTRLSSRALEAMMPYLTEQYANPAGTYSFTNASNAAMEKARKQVADVIGAKSAEIFFTSGGTESDNWALKGVMRANEKKGRHLIISAIEHHAILHSAKALEREGFDVTVQSYSYYKVLKNHQILRICFYIKKLPTGQISEISMICPVRSISEDDVLF